MRVTNNRGACCHVAGDIDFDKHNNLWLVTGDDSAAGSGDAGNWGQSIDQKTDENADDPRHATRPAARSR